MQEVAIEAALAINGPDRRGGDPESHGSPEGLAVKRDLLQVWKESSPGLVVGVADVIAALHALPAEFAPPRHGSVSLHDWVGPENPSVG